LGEHELDPEKQGSCEALPCPNPAERALQREFELVFCTAIGPIRQFIRRADPQHSFSQGCIQLFARLMMRVSGNSHEATGRRITFLAVMATRQQGRPGQVFASRGLRIGKSAIIKAPPHARPVCPADRNPHQRPSYQRKGATPATDAASGPPVTNCPNAIFSASAWVRVSLW